MDVWDGGAGEAGDSKRRDPWGGAYRAKPMSNEIAEYVVAQEEIPPSVMNSSPLNSLLL
jgi:hypothetical protein